MTIDKLSNVPKDLLRDLPGWNNAPVPVCMGGDYRALSWCCKPGSALTFGFKCRRDERLKEIGMTPTEFVKIKGEFSRQHKWNSEYPCFGSFSYCCMRSGGCSRRDPGLKKRYPDKKMDDIMKEYYSIKKDLANVILKNAKRQDLVKGFIDD